MMVRVTATCWTPRLSLSATCLRYWDVWAPVNLLWHAGVRICGLSWDGQWAAPFLDSSETEALNRCPRWRLFWLRRRRWPDKSLQSLRCCWLPLLMAEFLHHFNRFHLVSYGFKQWIWTSRPWSKCRAWRWAMVPSSLSFHSTSWLGKKKIHGTFEERMISRV